jgi:putative peptidoglycan lipid II flippase
LLNLAFVPVLQHAGLALAIGIGAVINALMLLIGLIRRGSYKPSSGWMLFLMQVIAASALLAVFLMWSASAADWTGLRAESLKRIGLMALVLVASAAIYFVALWAAGLKVGKLLQR